MRKSHVRRNMQRENDRYGDTETDIYGDQSWNWTKRSVTHWALRLSVHILGRHRQCFRSSASLRLHLIGSVQLLRGGRGHDGRVGRLRLGCLIARQRGRCLTRCGRESGSWWGCGLVDGRSLELWSGWKAGCRTCGWSLNCWTVEQWWWSGHLNTREIICREISVKLYTIINNLQLSPHWEIVTTREPHANRANLNTRLNANVKTFNKTLSEKRFLIGCSPGLGRNRLTGTGSGWTGFAAEPCWAVSFEVLLACPANKNTSTE